TCAITVSAARPTAGGSPMDSPRAATSSARARARAPRPPAPRTHIGRSSPRPDPRDMIIGLFSRCMGGVSTFAAMTRFPAAFDGVRCLVSPQPITPRYIAQRRLAVIGLGDRLDDFNILLRLRTSIGLERRIP